MENSPQIVTVVKTLLRVNFLVYHLATLSNKQQKLYHLLSELPISTVFGCPVYPAVDGLHGGSSGQEIPRGFPQG